MDTLLKADIFFFISSFAVVLLTAAVIVLVVYFVGTLRNVRKISAIVLEEAELVRKDIGQLRQKMYDEASALQRMGSVWGLVQGLFTRSGKGRKQKTNKENGKEK